MISSKAQIIATIGPASEKAEVLRGMLKAGLDVIRFNFSWGTLEDHARQIATIESLEKETGRHIPIIIDLPGPRIQQGKEHTYDRNYSGFTEEDKAFIPFAEMHKVEYVALSFVAGPDDVERCRKAIRESGGTQKIIAKIERIVALDALEKIITVADAVMIARGDLGNEVPIEKIPFVQAKIIQKCNEAGKPVIVATQMLLSMVNQPVPTRAEVTDVANAILEGADVVMLSDETTTGKYPLEAVTIMEKIVIEAEKHLEGKPKFHLL